ncbi:alpha/beta fold hydrolase [Streptomyces varsoviensis]|uniref:Alpha/beta hydrolase n=1 Tax=Streptomyces varsoviensis TaxID=67373 RepID=A0ABR5J8T2_9ACTN|nr:alpha/beta hydrolase [Streptomyces varsoviensis]KOG89853.1 alpha/beta hydrolase [Streptomyces varsoviensis]
MPVARINGTTLGYDVYGTGEPVVLVTGTAAPGRVWRSHQVPALRAAGYQTITLDNRGIGPSGPCEEGTTLADLAADVAGLIDHLGAGPCRLVGFSLGAIIVQELLLARPELAAQAVLMATCGRADALISAMAAADVELCDSDVKLPPRYAAYVQAIQNLSPRTLNDEQRLQGWLDIFEMSPVTPAGVRHQLGLQAIADRLAAYRRVRCPCLVIAFRDDLIARPHLGREVADSIPGGSYTEIAGCGHYGYLERPDEVNSAIIDFFARPRRSPARRMP